MYKEAVSCNVLHVYSQQLGDVGLSARPGTAADHCAAIFRHRARISCDWNMLHPHLEHMLILQLSWVEGHLFFFFLTLRVSYMLVLSEPRIRGVQRRGCTGK